MENTAHDIGQKMKMLCKRKKRNARRVQIHQGRGDDPEKNDHRQNLNHQGLPQNQHCQNITETIIMLICL
jgi:ribonuclease HI